MKNNLLPQPPPASRSPRPVPVKGGLSPARAWICDRCGSRMLEKQCKITCPNCGNRFDCSDLNLYFD
jgi:rubrerythrin